MLGCLRGWKGNCFAEALGYDDGFLFGRVLPLIEGCSSIGGVKDILPHENFRPGPLNDSGTGNLLPVRPGGHQILRGIFLVAGRCNLGRIFHCLLFGFPGLLSFSAALWGRGILAADATSFTGLLFQDYRGLGPMSGCLWRHEPGDELEGRRGLHVWWGGGEWGDLLWERREGNSLW